MKREYAGAAKATTLSGATTAGATTLNVVDATGWPTGAVGPFVITIDAGVTTEEKVLCSGRTGNSLAVQARGFDGTTASDHGNNARVEHTLSATDLREANDHVNDVSGDPHPQYLTPAEASGQYATAAHGHNYADPAHSHTYDSITLKPAVGLLAISPQFNFLAGTAGVPQEITNGSVTFTVPPSGGVLLRHSGSMRGSGGAGTTWFGQIGVGTASAMTTSSQVITMAGSYTVFASETYRLTGLTPGTSLTYKSFISGTNVDCRWIGYLEVWAAP